MPKASEIMRLAGIQLLDEDHIRWPLIELADWVNEGVKAIVLAKPSASSKSAAIQLVKGTHQTLPGTIDGKATLQLIGINRNLVSAAEPRQGLRAIRTCARDVLDAQEPNWHTASYVPFRKEVRQVIYDENLPTEFYVYPGNDGSGFVEAAFSFLPTSVKVANGADPEKIASWDIDVGLPEPYSVPLLDYVLYRCHQKDDTAADLGKATSHYQLFATAVGIKVQSEGTSNPNRRR
ncbi:unknown [Sinorhizobium phage PBC5]|uniref:structural protein n=1 Tax=Sinorhizobium phage PBC5 TaxID=179237 RepID=UPI000009BEC6|nr:structural protein [Sinorhizobium phage PBC5]AAL49590.1 unknown [Sinorhizobium phage PBC5]